jgi:hypothetical protein
MQAGTTLGKVAELVACGTSTVQRISGFDRGI